MEVREIGVSRSPIWILGLLACLLMIGAGMYLLRFCSERFMMLRRAKSATPYLYGIGGMLGMLLVTVATLGFFFLLFGLRTGR